jgi:2-methylcitrate dehydratase PrpD
MKPHHLVLIISDFTMHSITTKGWINIPNLTDQFIEELYSLSNSQYSDTIKHQAKRCLLDYIGVTIAGAKILKAKSEHLLNFLGDIAGKATVIGYGRKTSIQSAAFLNGLSAHVAELDDGVRFGMFHPGSPTISALLTIAEAEKLQGEALISGIIIGYEASTRLACAIQPSHYAKGYHPTSTCGTIGAAVGIASMLCFTKSEMKDAFSSAVVSASGTLKVLEDKSELKPLNVGRAALNGLIAAYFARAGFEGPNDVLTGNTGFLKVMSDQLDSSCLFNNTNSDFAIERVYFKPYASCRHTHSAIEATLNLRSNYNIKVKDIDTINIKTYHSVVGKHDHIEVHGISSAKMSIPFNVALAYAVGSVSLNEFKEIYINSAEILSLTKKVTVKSDDELTALLPDIRPAVVEIKTKDGRLYIERVDLPKGEPENPLSDTEIEDKFTALSTYGGKTNKECKEIIDVVWNLESQLNNLYRLLQ